MQQPGDNPFSAEALLGEHIVKVLAETRFLVWDTPTWLAVPADRIPAIEARVAEDFAPLLDVSEGSRSVVIYHRRQ